MGQGLRVRGLVKHYGDITALDGVELSVEPGRLVGFLGPNGAGKTTTMRAIMGLIAVDAGTTSWNGVPLSRDDRPRIGYMPQERGLYQRMRVCEHIEYIGVLGGLDRIDAKTRSHEWAERVGLGDRRDALLQELSTGNQQRVQLAVALIHDPMLLVLDEPFAGLDPVATATLRHLLEEQVAKGAAVVFSSHQLDVVQDLAEHACIVANGRTVAAGAVDELRRRSPHRRLEIRWTDTTPQWIPTGGTVIGRRGHRVSRFSVPATTDPASAIAEAAAVASIESVAFEPPDLDEVFIELVER